MSNTLEDFQKGKVLLIDKPLSWTSFDVVKKVRYSLKKFLNVKKIKVGHAGTLDPLATGLLILCVGKMTKSIETFQGQMKTYTGIIQLGGSTPSYDLETEVDQEFPTDHITSESIKQLIFEQFNGEIDQTAPSHSAKWVNGKRAYELARKGEDVVLKANKVHIYRFEFDYNRISKQVSFEIDCGKGTYIRSIAHDLGQKLNSGGHLIKLRRTAIGGYTVDDAMEVDAFVEKLFED